MLGPLPQSAMGANASANRDAGNVLVTEDALAALKSQHQQDELSFLTQENLQPSDSLLAISAPTGFRHLKTGGQGPLMPSNSQRAPAAPNFSRPRKFRPRSRSLPDLSPISEYSPRLSYYIKETLYNAPEPVPKSLSDTIMNATMTNNRLEIILDGLGELDAKVQNNLDTYLDSSASGSGSSSTSKTSGTSNSGLKRLLSRRKCQPAPPPRRPRADPSVIEDLRTRLSQIEGWGVQVQMARDVIKRQMADASERAETSARQAAKGAFIAKGRASDGLIEKLDGRTTYDVDVQWIMAGAEEFIADFDASRASPRLERGRARSRTMSVLSTWSDR